jgi:hypothetical protein
MPGFHARFVRHHFEVGVERGAAGAAEEVLVDFAGGTGYVVGFGGACGGFSWWSWGETGFDGGDCGWWADLW